MRRMADIGDRVRSGQPLAEIEAPELDDQVHQAKANLQQARAALDEALANYEQGKSNMEFARMTAERWSRLVARGRGLDSRRMISIRPNTRRRPRTCRRSKKPSPHSAARFRRPKPTWRVWKNYKATSWSRRPSMESSRCAIVDAGALVNAGNTLLFRIAQTGTLRTYVNVPQANTNSIRPGQMAHLSVSNLPGRQFTGTVARTANALDPNSRTLLVEVHVPNADGALLPGMYAQVDLSSTRTNPPMLIPSEALIVRADGTGVALVRPDHTVHLQKIQIGRDYGDRLEVSGGLKEGDMIIPNPGDIAREGLKVDPVSLAQKAPQHPAPTAPRN